MVNAMIHSHREIVSIPQSLYPLVSLHHHQKRPSRRVHRVTLDVAGECAGQELGDHGLKHRSAARAIAAPGDHPHDDTWPGLRPASQIELEPLAGGGYVFAMQVELVGDWLPQERVNGIGRLTSLDSAFAHLS